VDSLAQQLKPFSPERPKHSVLRPFAEEANRRHRVFPGRTHYILGQEGWTEVADVALVWIDSQRIRGVLTASAA
jgi:hypothetical protein